MVVVTLAQRRTQRGLGLNTVATLTLARQSAFQPCVIKARESAGFGYHAANLLRNTDS